jgi:16S rRNA (cytosine1402-N4)-methyltransferase
MSEGHLTVLLTEAVDSIEPRAGGVYVDGTFGGGGHSREILKRVDGEATLYVIDADPDAIARAEEMRSEPISRGVIPIHDNFRNLAAIADEHDLPPVDGMLFDLGLSSFQLDQAERGFAFRFDGPLDMRFDNTSGISAADLVNTASTEELASIIWRFGEEKQSRRIARTIVDRRVTSPFETTADLAATIESAVGGRRGRSVHPATRSFQALRIAVNEELSALEDVLEAAVKLLAPRGRLVVISFHSLEDRIVKQFIVRESAICICPPDVPVCVCHHSPRLKRIGKPIKPSAHEQAINSRSRSAIMRVAERLA